MHRNFNLFLYIIQEFKTLSNLNLAIHTLKKDLELTYWSDISDLRIVS